MTIHRKNLPIVAVDARMVSTVPHGIARYVTQIAKALRSIPDLPYRPIFLTSADLDTQARLHLFAGFETQTMAAPFLNPKEWVEIPRLLRKIRAALFHSPSFCSLWTCPCPSIITLHDLNHLHFGGLSKKIYYRTLLKRFCKNSKQILTVSEFSRNEIARWLDLAPSQIEITYNAVSRPMIPDPSSEISQILADRGLPPKSENYFFCLSNPKPHKNLPLLIAAYEIFRASEPAAWPLLISTPAAGPTPPGVYCLGSLSEKVAPVVLKQASALLFPSIYEGFGLPPLEAALLGVPLAVSQIPPHQEGLADLSQQEVHWVLPADLQGWVNAFRMLFARKILPASAHSQNQILERFSTERLGRTLDLIYRRVLT